MFKKSLFWTLLVFIFTSFNCLVMAEPIKVGLALPLTGYYAADGVGADYGLTMGVEEINKAGGLLGRQVEIKRFDVKDFAPEVLMQGADYLVRTEKVDAVFSNWIGWGQDVRAFGKYDIPFFQNDASFNAVEVFRSDPKQYSNVFMMNDHEVNLAPDYFDFMRLLPYNYPSKTVALIIADDDWSRGIGDGMKKRAKETGWEVVLHEIVPYGITEWGIILTKLKKANPGWIHFEVASPPAVISFLDQFKLQPTNSLINVGYAMYLRGLLENCSKNCDGIMGGAIGLGWPIAPTPEATRWMQRFRETIGIDPHVNGFSVYTEFMIWVEAVRSVGDEKNYSAICEYIANTPHKSIDGYTLKFNEDNTLPLSSWPLNHTQIQDGKFVVLNIGAGKKYQDNEFRVPPWIN